MLLHHGWGRGKIQSSLLVGGRTAQTLALLSRVMLYISLGEVDSFFARKKLFSALWEASNGNRSNFSDLRNLVRFFFGSGCIHPEEKFLI